MEEGFSWPELLATPAVPASEADGGASEDSLVAGCSATERIARLEEQLEADRRLHCEEEARRIGAASAVDEQLDALCRRS